MAVGIAGVVVVFRSESVHAWSPADKARLQLLLYNSTLPLTYCMAGLLLLSLKPPPLWTWRACSGLASACLLPFGVSTMRKLRRISPDFAAASFVSSAASVLGIFVLLLQFYNGIFLNAFAPFYAAVVAQIVLAVFQFVRLILLPPTSR